MCGIAGLLPRDPLSPDAANRIIRAMTASLAHRGPDGSGTWTDERIWLGHTRLSIVDLSSAGHQPMTDRQGRYVMVYNGEIYNHIELRAELERLGHRFTGRCDAEVLLAAYCRWGDRCLDRFEGMWAFAIWDRVAHVLFAARDRVGKKPFYYTTDVAGAFIFGSEICALRHLASRLRYHPQAAFDFLTQGTYGHLAEETFYDGIRQLPAAHKLRVAAGEPPRVARYWDLPTVRQSDRIPYDASFKRAFRETLEDAVRIRLRADVPVGATLSGGIDSSAIVGLMQRQMPGESIHVFTRQFPGTQFDESRYVDDVVARLRNPNVHRCLGWSGPTESDVLRVLDHQEEPFGDTSIVAHEQLMRMAREQGVPVLLSGQGGDELLLGYPSLVHAYLGSLIAQGRLVQGLSEVASWSRGRKESVLTGLTASAPHVLPLSLRDVVRRARVAHQARSTTARLRARVRFRRLEPNDGKTSLDSYIAQVFTRFSLPHLTQYDDRNAMSLGIECRMPFLDQRLIMMMFHARYDASFSRGRSKRVLRESCEDILPPSVVGRRDKIGFFSAQAQWLRQHRALIERTMDRDYLTWIDATDPAAYHRRLTAFLSGDDSAQSAVWRGFIFHLWTRRFDIAPPEMESGTARHVSGLA